MADTADVEVIRMQEHGAKCCICGGWDLAQWGVPVSVSTGRIIANESDAEWAAKAACRKCWKEHEVGKHVGKYPRF